MLEIEELLNERKDYMRETCPAYRLVCAEYEALVEILGSWPGISEAFRSYEAYRHMVCHFRIQINFIVAVREKLSCKCLW